MKGLIYAICLTVVAASANTMFADDVKESKTVSAIEKHHAILANL